MLARTLILKVSGWGFVEKLVRRSFLFRPMVKRFIGGDTIQDGLAASRPLLDRGFLISLDLLGENVSTQEESEAAKRAYIEMIELLAAEPVFKPLRWNAESKRFDGIENLNISIKLTQCGLDIGDDYAEANYRDVLQVARRHGTFVRVDMESSAYTERTIRILERVGPEFPEAGTVVQSYLRRTPDDVERLARIPCRVRLVKGAYLEPATVAFTDKTEVDRAFVELAKLMLDKIPYPAFATHDPNMVDAILAHVAEKDIPRDSFEFQMLYGIRRDLQDRLLKEGYNVRIYVPFGEQWYPYFTRRLAERPANVWFILRSLFRG